jgi:hypothetical protein
MKLPAEFYRLPYRYDVDRLVEELAGIPEDSWIPHPDHHVGNTALPLVSLHGEDNDLFHGPMKTTPHLARLEYVQQVIASLGEVYGRSRLMRLAPGCEVPLHTDTNYHWYNRVRIHVPITTTPEVMFHCGEKVTHMAAGECWIFDAWRQHRVTNNSDQTRVHLVFDTAGSSRFWDTVARSERPCDANGSAVVDDQFIAYKPGRRVQILTEKYNATPVKSPGEVDGLIADLIIDYEADVANERVVCSEYTRQLKRFARDWRMLFSLYGYESAGIEQYSGLINATAESLRSVKENLKVASNQQDVRTVFFGRVLDAALEPDRMVDYAPRFESHAPAQPQPATDHASGRRVGRNEPCPCGSGKKFKHCHG